jgi:hypothetical protein
MDISPSPENHAFALFDKSFKWWGYYKGDFLGQKPKKKTHRWAEFGSEYQVLVRKYTKLRFLADSVNPF